MGKRVAVIFAVILIMFTAFDTSEVEAASKSVKENEKQVDKLEKKK